MGEGLRGVVEQIQTANLGRDPVRLAIKYRKMRADAFSFLRGTCHLFYSRLPSESVLRKAPAAWTCGDLHLENFGSYKGDNRLVYFDINDFDEAALAPSTWDPLRLITSVLVARSIMRVTQEQALQLCDVYLRAHAEALAEGKARWLERETAPSPISDLLESLRDRSRPEFLDRRTVKSGRRRRIRIDREKALAASEQQKTRVRKFFEEFEARQPRPGFFEVLDIAIRIAGTGSLGVDRYVVLVRGKGSPDGNYLLDLKQALPSSLQRRTPLDQPAWRTDAQRIVAVQRRMQAISMAFLHAVRIGPTSYVLRGLQPREDRVALTSSRDAMPRLVNLLTAMAQCTAWAQLRSSGRQGSAVADALIDFGSRDKWRRALTRVARECAAQCEQDWKTFCAAYDDGEFDS